ncbi:MAG TPA: recombinase family protein [Methylomirabilota bacterium]|nr:recombinase family protein [Methylomirabilota bacterium]
MSMFGKSKKVAIYTRVSTDEQKTDLQLMDLKEYVQRRGYETFQFYEDIISGAAKERKSLDQLMDDAKKRKFDIVLVWKFDRFARSLKMLVDGLALFQELGIDFISYKENIDTTTSMGKLIFNINSAYAEFERDIIRDRVKAGIKAKREKTGIWGRGKVADTIQTQIHELINQGISIRNVAKQLNVAKGTVMKYK